ncbi:MAG: prolyl oligopeptidase family serine peptidase [Planctomycetota bacterium]
MRTALFSLLVLLPTLGSAALAQSPRALTHDDYDAWPTLSGETPSPDGAWLAYTVGPARGDKTLEVRQVDGETVHRFPRGTSARFTDDSRFLVFGVGSSEDAWRAERVQKLREAIEAGKGKFDEPKKDADADLKQLHILELASGNVTTIDRVESFELLEQTGFVVYVPRPEKKKGDEAKEEKAADAGAESPEANRGRRRRGGDDVIPGDAAPDEPKKGFQARDGKLVVVRNLSSGEETRLEWVLSQRAIADDRWLVFDVQKKPAPAKKVAEPAKKDAAEGSPETTAPQSAEGAAAAEAKPAEAKPAEAAPEEPVVDQGLFALELKTGRRVELADGPANFGGFATDREDRTLVFWTDLADKDAEEPEIAYHRWDFRGSAAQLLIAADHPAIPEGRRLSKSGLGFSRDGSVLTFSVELDREAPMAPIFAEDKVVLDLWHWKDGQIQPMQAKQRGRDAWSAVCFLDDQRVQILGDDHLPTMRLITDDGSRAMATDSDVYAAEVSWDGRYSDTYVINTIDGSRHRVIEHLRGSASPSPTGRYLMWFDANHWSVLDLATMERRALTTGISTPFWREADDRPEPAGSYGVAGWLPHDKAVVLYDQYDLWTIDPQTGAASCLTDGQGRASQTIYRVARVDLEPGPRPDEDEEGARWLDGSLVLSTVHEPTKASGYAVDSTLGVVRPRQLVRRDARLADLVRPKKADRVFYTLSSYADFPDVHTADLAFGGERKLTDANPMLDEVRWGKAELVSWHSADGIPLQGKLVKPDGFDPSKKYPMLVYFYERLSDGLHRHVTPAAGTSPNAAYYVSNGYLWFEPDIVYREGYPGESALKCIVPGVQSLIAEGFVDAGAIGIAGHSWGGYQTSYLVTKTNLFAAAESGAPVSNMVSAYGGIRWGSGMSRQFQYEQTQSRIGGTLWEVPMRYLENSPIFFADKVETPVLMLHNDQDGAVPWYQGIEYFMALRRLGKEAYLFNYVGEDHGLRKRQNMLDWTRRMQEFFDHHLRGVEAAAWIADGVKYADREKEKIPHAPSYREAMESAAAATEASGDR